MSSEAAMREVIESLPRLALRASKFILSEPSAILFLFGQLVVPISLYFLYWWMPDIFKEGLIYFNILNNRGPFSVWAFLLLPIGSVVLLAFHSAAIKFGRRIALSQLNSVLTADCVVPPAAGLLSAAAFFFYGLFFVPLSATWVGLSLFLWLTLGWAYLYLGTSPEAPKPIEFYNLFKNVGIGFVFISGFFFFFPNTKDMRNLAETTGNWHYYWFTVGQYSIIGAALVYSTVMYELLIRVEWLRRGGNSKLRLRFLKLE